MQLYGNIGPYDRNGEEWPAYCERVELYLDANNITNEEQRRAVFLSTCGASTYQLIRSLVAPSKLTDKALDELYGIVKEHLAPAPSSIMQRYKFNARSQKEGENLLRDRLVCGLRDDRAQRRLLAESKLTFAKAFEIAQASELAEQGVRTLQPPVAGVNSIPKSDDRKAAVNAVNTESEDSQAPRGPCFRCGRQTFEFDVQCVETAPSLLGRDWVSVLALKLEELSVLHTRNGDSLQGILERHAEMFQDELGLVRGLKVKLHMKDSAKPRFYKAHPVPYALREKMEAELVRLEKSGVIEKVQFSEWAAPVVPILKRDGSIRLCGDYKLTINRAAIVDPYPLPRIEDISSSIGNAKVFSKLDLAWQQFSPWRPHAKPAAGGRHIIPDFPRGTRPRCSKMDHGSKDCPFKETVCNYCQKMGHFLAACLKKRKEQQPVRTISKHSIQTAKVIDSIPRVQQPLQIKGQDFTIEVDTGAGDNFCSVEVWTKIGKPILAPASCRYEVANGQPLATLGTFQTVVCLQNACEQLCTEFTDLFKPELGCLKDFRLEGISSRMQSWVNSRILQLNTCRTYVLFFNVSMTKDSVAVKRSAYMYLVNPLLSIWGYTLSSKGVANGHKADAGQSNSTANSFQLWLLSLILCTDSPRRMSSGNGEQNSNNRYPDGSERPIGNASKTLTDTQRRYRPNSKRGSGYSICTHQFLYSRNFIMVTDHKPLLSLFGPNKATPIVAANRLARWALLLNQYSYFIEYRKTTDHGNANALSRLPFGPDPSFDGEEGDADMDTVCAIRTISLQLNPMDPGVLAKESAKDPVLAKYPCIHPVNSTSTKATTELLEQDFAHFGYPHTVVTDNATSFISEEFQAWCKEWGITHLTGAPQVARVAHTFKVGDPCYALYCGPWRNKDPRWVPAVVTKVFGPRSVNVRVFPHGATWRRHVEQLQYHYGSLEDSDPGELPAPVTSSQVSVEPLPSNDLPLAESGMLENY
eukprot:Em0002g1349a